MINSTIDYIAMLCKGCLSDASETKSLDYVQRKQEKI